MFIKLRSIWSWNSEFDIPGVTIFVVRSALFMPSRYIKWFIKSDTEFWRNVLLLQIKSFIEISDYLPIFNSIVLFVTSQFHDRHNAYTYIWRGFQQLYEYRIHEGNHSCTLYFSGIRVCFGSFVLYAKIIVISLV